MIPKIKKIYLIIVSAISFGTMLLQGCSGGTEVGNPSVVVGQVINSDKSPVHKAQVYLVAPDYNPILDSIISIEDSAIITGVIEIESTTRKLTTFTDAEGKFYFHNVPEQTYNLFISSPDKRSLFFKSALTIVRDSINLGTKTLSKPLTGLITIDESVFQDSSFLVMPGTPLLIPVEQNGYQSVTIPSDTVNIQYFKNDGTLIASIVNQKVDRGAVDSSDIIDLTGIEHVLIPPTLAYINNNDTLYFPSDVYTDNYTSSIEIQALSAFSNKNHPLEYQFFDIRRNTLSKWDSNSVYLLPVPSSGQYAVSCRVRSARDNSVITSWTPNLMLNIIKQVNDSIVLGAPLTPVVIDSTGKAGTAPYKILVQSSFVADTIPLQYQLLWQHQDTVSFKFPWQNDSLFSVIFPEIGHYTISARIRNASDTTQGSMWSSERIINVK